MSKNRPATIVEVARRAGVSAATVSRVMNHTAAVGPETARRVHEAVAALNYSPHPAARQLVMRRSNHIGVLLPEIDGSFFRPLFMGIETGVREAGYDLLIYLTRSGDSSRPLVDVHNTDGLIIFAGSLAERDLQRMYRLDFPVVLLHQTPPRDCPYPLVTAANQAGAERLIRHLVEEHDRRRIVYLRGPASHEASLWRERGYCAALQALAVPADPGLVRFGGFAEQEAFDTIAAMLAEGIDFDAVFAGDDAAAVGTIAALREAGRQVPSDVAVVGFDDQPYARFVHPPLTTVRAPVEQVGQAAARLLVQCIRKQPHETRLLFPTELVIRQSCGCKPGGPPERYMI